MRLSSPTGSLRSSIICNVFQDCFCNGCCLVLGQMYEMNYQCSILIMMFRFTIEYLQDYMVIWCCAIMHNNGHDKSFLQGVLGDSLTFGPKTRHSVIVVQKIMKRAIMRQASSVRSLMMNEIGTPDTHMITMLYTLIPMYLESFRAGMVTCLVSHARKQPIN